MRPARVTRTLPTSRCPHCRRVLDRASSETGDRPRGGDVTICLYCATVLIFTPTLGVRLPTLADLSDWTETDWATLVESRQAVVAFLRAAADRN
jgi:hypothetical protein